VQPHPQIDPTREIFDVVDGDDRVIDQASRAEVHRRGWLHRAVHMFIFNTQRQLLIHLRAATKDEFPSRWTSSASGHVDAGESYEEAAARELCEELGMRVPLQYVFTHRACAETANEHSALYEAVTDQVPKPDPGEISRLEWISLEQLRTELASDDNRFTPPFRVLANRFLTEHSANARHSPD